VKGWYAQHKDTGKWHKIEDVKDTGISAEKEGGGNNYHLEGVDKPVHQSKIIDMRAKVMNKSIDKISGGKADKKNPSDFDAVALKEGTKHEMEHTDNHDIAREIAMDHLSEDPKYYDKLKEIEKYDRVDREADGKRELDYGKEELEKDPKSSRFITRKELMDKWNKLKKALSSSDAIMEITSQEYQDEEDDNEQENESVDPDNNSEQLEEQGGEDDNEQENESVNSADEIEQPGEQGEEEQPEEPEMDDSSELEEMLREEGYSEAEIAYVVHNHMMPQSTVDDIKMDGHKAQNDSKQDAASHDLEHKKRMNDLEYQKAQGGNDDEVAQHELEHKKRMSDLEYDTAQQEQGINDLDRQHKQRMLDLEFEAAKREKELELQFKEKELELKLQGKKESQVVATTAKKDAAKSRKMDAAKTSNKEKKGK